MWNLKCITNNYAEDVILGYCVQRSGILKGFDTSHLGSISVLIPLVGALNFVDIGDKPLGPTSQTWGVHITFGQQQWVYRYEGGGAIELIINQDGTINLQGEYWPVIPLLQTWQGTYETGAKWGGTQGEWHTYAPLTITEQGEVKYGDNLLKSVTFKDNELAWEFGPNSTAGCITFKNADNNPYFWGDDPATDSCFTGWLRDNPSDGPLDFKGLLKVSPAKLHVQEVVISE